MQNMYKNKLLPEEGCIMLILEDQTRLLVSSAMEHLEVDRSACHLYNNKAVSKLLFFDEMVTK